MLKKIIAYVMTVVMAVSLIGVNAEAADSDNWSVTYTAGYPTYMMHQTDSLSVTFYGEGFVARADTLTGSYNRYITIEGQYGTIISEDDSIMITTTDALTSVFHTTGGYVTSYFKVVAHGSSSCSSTGWIYINSPNIYNN